MQKILMILTHDRTDCLRLNLDMMHATGSLRAFDKVVLLLNGVPRSHRAAVERFISEHPDVSWDSLDGPGTRPAGLVGLQNRCVEKYPGALYVKSDEDVFVPRDWTTRMFAAYEKFRHRENLALITPLIPNNGYGLFTLLTHFYPRYLEDHRRLFGRDPTPERQGFTWHSPKVAEWATRLFLELEIANEHHRALLAKDGTDSYVEFSDSFSIPCICYDYRHWKKMGGVPPHDEPEWCDWIAKNHCFNVLDCTQIVLHYSFFVQQDWLDRSSLLEDIRMVNLPGTLPSRSLLKYHLPRARRFGAQIPSIIKRRLMPA